MTIVQNEFHLLQLEGCEYYTDLQVAASKTLATDQLCQKEIEVPTPLMLWALGRRPPFSTRAPASEIISYRRYDTAFLDIGRLGFFGDRKNFLGLLGNDLVLDIEI